MRDWNGGQPWPFVLKAARPEEVGMGLTGKYQFRRKFWGKVVLQVEEEVKPLWSKSGDLKRRWRDATLMDLAAPEMRFLIDMRFKPYLYARSSSIAPEG